jgi:hypothetical protein
LIGHNHPVHGTIGGNGERSWSNPYPSGPGGGFEALAEEMNETMDMDEGFPTGAIPANEEAAEAMGVDFNESDRWDGEDMGYEDEGAG